MSRRRNLGVKNFRCLNPLSANPTKWPNTLKQRPTNCLSLFDHFVKLALKGLKLRSKQAKLLMECIEFSIISPWFKIDVLKIFFWKFAWGEKGAGWNSNKSTSATSLKKIIWHRKSVSGTWYCNENSKAKLTLTSMHMFLTKNLKN